MASLGSHASRTSGRPFSSSELRVRATRSPSGPANGKSQSDELDCVKDRQLNTGPQHPPSVSPAAGCCPFQLLQRAMLNKDTLAGGQAHYQWRGCGVWQLFPVLTTPGQTGWALDSGQSPVPALSYHPPGHLRYIDQGTTYDVAGTRVSSLETRKGKMAAHPRASSLVSILATAFICCLVCSPAYGQTQYAIHLTVPLTDPTSDPVQVGQWVAAAQVAAASVTARWGATTGNSLSVLVLDNHGNSNTNVENALGSILNTSNVVALLLAENEVAYNLADDIARMGRYFKVRSLADQLHQAVDKLICTQCVGG